MYFQPNPELWQYFIFNSDIIGADWRKAEGTEDVYRLVIVRKDKHPGLQGVFYTFPEADEFDTKDMYKRHPTLPDHWIYYGRSDNIIVFSNGEKLNPVTIEEIVVDHPGIKGALVVGSDRFQAGLLLEPVINPKNDQEAEQLLDSVWPYVAEANRGTATYGQIARQFIALASPDKPFHRAGKGTVQRASTLKLYKEEIDKLYEEADKAVDGVAPQIDMNSEDTLAESIKDIFGTKLDLKGNSNWTPIFSRLVLTLYKLSMLPDSSIADWKLQVSASTQRRCLLVLFMVIPHREDLLGISILS